MIGSDTSSTTLASWFFYLSRYPDVYEKVSKEVRYVFNSPDQVCIGPALNSCTYLRACLDESLRMAPAVASAPWREVMSDGALIDGCRVPAGYDVGIGIYSIQHHETYFPQPFKFMPERWLVNSSAASTREKVDQAHSAFAPFSIGPRSCLGKGLAIAELLFIMASVLVIFDFKKPNGAESLLGGGSPSAPYGQHRKDEYQLIDHLISTKDGPMLQFRQRTAFDGHTASSLFSEPPASKLSELASLRSSSAG